VFHGVHADGPLSCPLCGEGPVRKVITAANVHYKGSGWAKKERRATVAAGAAKPGTEAGGSEDGSKSETAVASETRSTETSSTKEPSGSDRSSGADTGTSKKAEKSSTAGASKTTD
jgi:predicted nucleic acid-binding Zn ribbon protein